MPFLENPFEHDIFVSYSHGDFDGAGHSPLNSWSQQFAKDLDNQIRQIRHFRELRLFLDESQRPDQGVDPTIPLTTQLQHDIKASGLLLILMTPDYLASEWCTNERDWWFAENQQTGIEVEGRVFVCRVIPNVTNLEWKSSTDHEIWPDVIKDQEGHGLTGFWFHSRDDVDFATVPFRWEGSTDDVNNYNKVMRELVRRVTRRLVEIKQHQEELAADLARLTQLTGSSQVIYLHARETQSDAWQMVQQTLRENGHTVFPGAPETQFEGQQLDAPTVWRRRQERILQLADCDALLLLGTEPSSALDTDLLMIGHRDRHSARDLTGKLLPCALLNQAGRTITSAEAFGIAHIDARTGNWPDDVADWLCRCGRSIEAVQ